ncbi:hypothetical protein M2X98_28355, partial [Klebsiella pneumoniae]|nr:hypothetical protein [Klebsiella pneumoniae]MDZ1844051.1 hypothetical protein [Klebsiella pneumoniae]
YPQFSTRQFVMLLSTGPLLFLDERSPIPIPPLPFLAGGFIALTLSMVSPLDPIMLMQFIAPSTF